MSGFRGQSKKSTLFETIINTSLGILIGMYVQMLIFPFFDIHDVSASSNFVMALIFAGTSIIRGYVVRRSFNLIQVRKHNKKALN